MSSIDSTKEEYEHSCLEKAIQVGYTLSNKTGEILRFLDGEPVERDKKDRPDIVRECIRGKKKQKIIVGVEHFLVNQISKKKGNKVLSPGKESEKHLSEIYESGHAELIETGDVSSQNIELLVDQTFKYCLGYAESNYFSFITAFQFHLERHMQRVTEYRENIEKLGIPGNEKIEIALLIELQTNFPYLYLHNNGGFTINKGGMVPVTYDMVRIMERVDKNLVDYIILYQSQLPWLTGDMLPGVIAIRTGNIRKHLENQNIPIFQYLESKAEWKLNKSSVEKVDDESFTFNLRCEELSDYFSEKNISSTLRQMYIYDRSGTPFAVEKIVHDLWMASKKYIYKMDGDVLTVLSNPEYNAKIVEILDRLKTQ